MGINSIVNACSHLQNSSRAKLGLTSLPNNKYNLLLALAMHRAGFISGVTRGGPNPPLPEQVISEEAPDPNTFEPVTSANVATRRLWLGLKYWDGKPVMRKIVPVSKPSRLVMAQLPQLNRIARGFEGGQIKGLNLGECLFLSTDRGVLEIREALEKKVGGLILCRVS